MDFRELAGSVAPFVLLALLLVGTRYRYGLTYALLYFLVGLILVAVVPYWLVIGLVHGFGPRPWATGLMILLLWGLFYGIDLLMVRPYSPSPAHEEGLRANPDVVDQWTDAGITDYRVWRLRPRSKGLVYAYRALSQQAIVYAYFERGRWLSLIVSTLDRGSGYLVTGGESLGLFDLRELRQIVPLKDWKIVSDLHIDAIRYLEDSGVVVDPVGNESLLEPLLEMNQRDRRAMLRFPVGFLGSMFRPLFHVGRLRTRVGRHWQLRQFR